MADSIYTRAADVLRERGRCKGTFQGNGGSVCVEGAVRVACHGSHLGQDPVCALSANALSRILFDQLGPSTILTQWNDLPSTTDDDVFALLARADEEAKG